FTGGRAHFYPQSGSTVRIFTTGQTPWLRIFTGGRAHIYHRSDSTVRIFTMGRRPHRESDNLTHANSFHRSGCADLPAVVRRITGGQAPRLRRFTHMGSKRDTGKASLYSPLDGEQRLP